MVGALITLIVIAVLVAFALWVVRYLNAPKFFEVAIIVLAALICIVVLADALGAYDFGLHFHAY